MKGSGPTARRRSMADTSHGTVEDYYATLGVARDATAQDIKRAFRKIARECHPDVAGENATAAERFKRARRAYEVLVDPVERSRYDRRRQPRRHPFEGAWWDRQGEMPGAEEAQRAASRPGNNLDLEDIFNDFGAFTDFGFGAGRPPARPPPAPAGRPSSSWQPPPPAAGAQGPTPTAGSHGTERPPPPRQPQPGRDISLVVHVPADIAARGGIVTLRYSRLRRSDDGSQLERYDEIYDLRVPPHTQHGDTLRGERMGDAGLGGHPSGDLTCDVVVPGTQQRPPAQAQHSQPEDPDDSPIPSQNSGTEQDPLPLPMSVTEALLGGRIEYTTPCGPVRLVVPPCTSSGTVFRLKGRNHCAADGSPRDLYLAARVIMPDALDDESRKLIQQFARLNPYDPRS